MNIKIVTDSTADLPAKLAHDLGITVVPLMVNFGQTTFIDGIDISAEEFYPRLQQSQSLPTTSQPAPADFVKIYQELGKDADGIVSIHISQKLSGTHNSATLARESVAGKCPPIEVIDSFMGSMGLGLIVIQAARAAQKGANMEEVVQITRQAMEKTHFFGMVDTLEYLHKGGRIGKAQVLVGTLLHIKPIIHCVDGEVHPLGKERTRKRGLNKLFETVKGYKNIAEATVLHSTTPEDASDFIDRIASLVPRDKIIQARIGPIIGTYLGPGTIAVGIRIGEV